MTNNYKTKNKGFTLIELIIVIIILAILVLIAVPKYSGYKEKAKLTEIKANIKILENASELYYINNHDWPRLIDTPYTAEEVESFAQEIKDRTGATISLEPEGKYYPINYDELRTYVQEPKDGVHYILQNPVGRVFYLDNLSDVGKKEFEYKIDKNIIAVISMSPEEELYPLTNIIWNSNNSIVPEGDYIINEEWINKKDSYPVGTHTVKLRVQNQNGLWSNWATKTFTVKETKNLSFNGLNSFVLSTEYKSYFESISKNFTYEFWVYPEATQTITSQTTSGIINNL